MTSELIPRVRQHVEELKAMLDEQLRTTGGR